MKLIKKSKLLILSMVVLTPIAILTKTWISSYLNNKKCSNLRPQEEKRFGEKKDRDLVDESVWESFPCSDPPAHAARLD